ncbi:MAG: glycosyltransferase family 2 protein [Nanoarchaeota archaeon]
MKVVVVMPAYNSAKTLRWTYNEIPKKEVDEIILTDDCSKDNTVEIAKELGIKVFQHKRNRGYGGNQKTCYTEALKASGDIIVMLHPDYQYDPKKMSKLIQPLKEGRADVVYGSRMAVKGGAKKGGMPSYKQTGNKLLTWFFNAFLGTRLSDAATGYIAYSRKALIKIPFKRNSDGYTFDEEAIIQCVALRLRIVEVPIPTRYLKEMSSIKFWQSVKYGARIFLMTLLFGLHRLGFRQKRFMASRAR